MAIVFIPPSSCTYQYPLSHIMAYTSHVSHPLMSMRSSDRNVWDTQYMYLRMHPNSVPFSEPSGRTHISMLTSISTSNPVNATSLGCGTSQKSHQKRDNGPQMEEGPCADSSGVYLKRGVESQWGEVSANSDQRRACASGLVWNKWIGPTGGWCSDQQKHTGRWGKGNGDSVES